MTQRSTLLKVISIIMIIFGAIAVFTTLGSLAALGAMSSSFGVDLGMAFEMAGFNSGLYMFALVIEVIAAIMTLVAGIIGLASKSKGLIEKVGIILIILHVIDLILCFALGLFGPMVLVGFILPILYYLGAKQCVQ